MLNQCELCYYIKHLLRTLCLLLVGHGFDSEFPDVQWETANIIKFTISQSLQYYQDECNHYWY